MLYIIGKVFYKIQLKFNKIRFVSHPGISFGKNFKLGYSTTYIIHPTSSAKFGKNIDIRNNFNLVLGKKANLIIEDNVFINNYFSVNCLDSIEIGENTLFGEAVKLYDHNHDYTTEPSFKIEHQKFNTAPIKIGKSCWLGSNVIVLKGVTIGDNVIIGAGCVIHKDIPSNSIIVNKQDHLVKAL